MTKVSDELYRRIDEQMVALKQQLLHQDGYKFDPSLLLFALQAMVMGWFKAVGGDSPSATNASELIPRGWVVVADVTPRDHVDVSKLKLVPTGSYVASQWWSVCYQSANLGANLGLVDGRQMLQTQGEIPDELRGFDLSLPGTILQDLCGRTRIPCLCYHERELGSVEEPGWRLEFAFYCQDYGAADRLVRLGE